MKAMATPARRLFRVMPNAPLATPLVASFSRPPCDSAPAANSWKSSTNLGCENPAMAPITNNPYKTMFVPKYTPRFARVTVSDSRIQVRQMVGVTTAQASSAVKATKIHAPTGVKTSAGIRVMFGDSRALRTCQMPPIFSSRTLRVASSPSTEIGYLYRRCVAFAPNSSRNSKATLVRFSGWLNKSSLRSASSCASPGFAPALMVSSIEPCSFPASQSLAARSAMVSAPRSTGGFAATVVCVACARAGKKIWLNVGPNGRLNARRMAKTREEIIMAFYSGFGASIVVFNIYRFKLGLRHE